MGKKQSNPSPPDVSLRPDPPPPPPSPHPKRSTDVDGVNSWNTIKKIVCTGTKAGTLGRNIAVSKAARLFVSLQAFLVDYDDAVSLFNADNEVRDAIASAGHVKELIDAGILSEKF